MPGIEAQTGLERVITAPPHPEKEKGQEIGLRHLNVSSYFVIEEGGLLKKIGMELYELLGVFRSLKKKVWLLTDKR